MSDYVPSPAVQDIIDLCQRILKDQQKMLAALEVIAAPVRCPFTADDMADLERREAIYQQEQLDKDSQPVTPQSFRRGD